MAASSTVGLPATTLPSTGIREPGRISTRSPWLTTPIDRALDELTVEQHHGCRGQVLQQVRNGLTSAAHRESFKYFGHKNEQRDDQCREEFSDDQRCQQS